MNLEELREYCRQNYGARLCDDEGNVLYDPLHDIDESALDRTDRLGVAYCRLNSWEWDEYMGPKPENFDSLPEFDKNYMKRVNHPIIMRILERIFPTRYAKKSTKQDYIRPKIKRIEQDIGGANVSRCHWVYGMKRTEDEWRQWYYSDISGE